MIGRKGLKDLDTLRVIFLYNLRSYQTTLCGDMGMFVKIIIIVFLLVILYALGSSFYFMVRDKGEGERTLKRLMWRIGLSLLLLAILYIMFLAGWIEPSAGPVNLTGQG